MLSVCVVTQQLGRIISGPGLHASNLARYPAQGTDANLRIIKGDGTVIKSISLSDLNTFSKVNVGDKSGAKLTDLLDWAGVLSTYSKVTIVSASGSVQLTKDKVTDQTILIVENNSVSFASQSVPTDQWLNGVTD